MRSKRLLAVLLVAVVLGVAHWMYWYAPRQRPGRPEASSLVGSIYLRGELPTRVWLPYPHQNLARLEKAIGPLDRLLAEVGELSGEPVPRLPAFGGLRLPPCNELVLASDRVGERFVVAARVYPLVGLLSRWAGRLAGNPLLAGGETRVGGRWVEVRWERGTWLLTSRGLDRSPSRETAGSERRPGGAALAWLRLHDPDGRVPAGEYRLERRGGDVEILAGDPMRLGQLAELAARSAPLPLIRAEGRRHGDGAWCRVFALLPDLESVGGLPGVVTVARGGEPFELPGERLVEVIGDGVRQRQVGAWTLRALDRASLASGERLAAFGDALAPSLPLDLALWVDLRSADRLVERVVTALEAVPVLGRREAKRWRQIGDLLARLSRFRRLTVLVSPSPMAVHVRLEAAVDEASD